MSNELHPSSLNYDATVIATRSVKLGAGVCLNDTFEVESLINPGGMSEVYKGFNIRTREVVALKILIGPASEDPQMLDLLAKEASILNRINHPAIVRYYIFTTDRATGLSYIAMEYVAGPSLRELIRYRPLSVAEASRAIRRAALGMQTVHDEGIIHRDLSCENIILAESDPEQAKVIDFGIAKTNHGDGRIGDTVFVGKFGYVAPEQFGLYGGKITASSDIYSLGLTYAAALMGRPLDMGAAYAEAARKRQSLPDLSMINPTIKPALERMLQPNPSLRPQSMAEVAELLLPFTGVARESTRHVSVNSLYSSPILRPTNPWPARIIFIASLGVLIGGAGYFSTLEQGAAVWKNTQETLIRLSQPAPPQSPPTVNGKVEGKIGESNPGIKPALPTSAMNGVEKNVSADASSSPIIPPTPIIPSPVAVEAKPPKPNIQQQVALPATIPQVMPATLAQWVAQYNGGGCFFARLLTNGSKSADIEAFGPQIDPIEKFETDFMAANHFEPTIGFRKIDNSQCSALDFISTHRKTLMPLSSFGLSKDLLEANDRLYATIDAPKWPNTTLLAIDEHGRSLDLTSTVRAAPGQSMIDIPATRLATLGPEHFLLIAITTSQVWKPKSSAQVSDIFSQLDKDMRDAGLNIEIGMKFMKRKK